MSVAYQWIAPVMALIGLAGCASPVSPAAPDATATIISCSDATRMPDGPLLPAFTPAYPCQLEQAESHAACANPDNTPPSTCNRDEKVIETALSEDGVSVFYMRKYDASAGCWHGTTWGQMSLKRCDKTSGAVTLLAEDLISALTASPDGAWLAFVAAEPGSAHLKPHIYKIGKDGSALQQLDTARTGLSALPFVAIGVMGWSDDGNWLDVTLWDGSEGGHYAIWLKTDGSGAFEERQ